MIYTLSGDSVILSILSVKLIFDGTLWIRSIACDATARRRSLLSHYFHVLLDVEGCDYTAMVRQYLQIEFDQLSSNV